jgi:hypothetical protein
LLTPVEPVPGVARKTGRNYNWCCYPDNKEE